MSQSTQRTIASASPENPEYLHYRNAALGAAKQQVKATRANLFGMNLINADTVPVYVKFYDALAANVTVGTTAPVYTRPVPAGNGVTPGLVEFTPEALPIRGFATALTVAAVTGLADSGTTAPATPIHVELTYK